jgi:VWFA-related protein
MAAYNTMRWEKGLRLQMLRMVGRFGWLPGAIAVLVLFAGRLAVAQSPAGPITPPAPKAQPTLQTPKAAQTAATPKIAVEAKLVYLYVTVRDKKGKLIPDLNQQDFVLEEDGKTQTITHFVRNSDLPLTLGLLVDTSLSQRNVLDDERSASYKFLDQMLREGKDEAFVIHFDREVELLQDLTASRPKLNAALQQLQTPQPQLENANGGNNGNDGGDSGTNTTDPDENVPTSTTTGGNDRQRGDSGGGTLLYDAIYLASKDEISKQQGRKAIFVLSDGVDRGSKETLTAAIEAAQRADTAVYSIFFADNNSNDNGYGHHGWGHGGGGWPGGGGGWPGGGGGHRNPQQQSRTDGKEILKRISTETGGELFQVSKKLPLDQIFAQAEEQLRAQYSLGYMPDHKDSGAGYHKISLATKTKDQGVQVRDGYYSDN